MTKQLFNSFLKKAKHGALHFKNRFKSGLGKLVTKASPHVSKVMRYGGRKVRELAREGKNFIDKQGKIIYQQGKKKLKQQALNLFQKGKKNLQQHGNQYLEKGKQKFQRVLDEGKQHVAAVSNQMYDIAKDKIGVMYEKGKNKLEQKLRSAEEEAVNFYKQNKDKFLEDIKKKINIDPNPKITGSKIGDYLKKMPHQDIVIQGVMFSDQNGLQKHINQT